MRVHVLADITWGCGLLLGAYATRELAVRASGVAPSAWRVDADGVLRTDTNPGDTRPDAQRHLHVQEHELRGPTPTPADRSRLWVRVDHLHDYVWVSGVFATAAAAMRDSDLRSPDAWTRSGADRWQADVTTTDGPTHGYTARVHLEACDLVRA